jgi:adenylate cyclase
MQPVIIFVLLSIVVASSFVLGNHAPFAPLEAMLADIRTSRLARSDAVDPRVVIIAITEESLDDNQALSPIDRRFLARLITAVDSAAPASIGLDILFDRPTQPASDQVLLKTLGSISAPLVMVGTAVPAAFERSILAGRQIASPALNADGNDGVVRDFTERDRAGLFVLAASMAKISGRTVMKPSFEIRYALTPSGELPFRIIPAHLLLANPSLQATLTGQHILIGGIFNDSDRHLTPLRFVEGSPDRLPGVIVHAFQLRQLLSQDQGSNSLLWSILLTGLAAVIGFTLGRSVFPTLWQSIILLFSFGALGLSGVALFAVAQVMVNLVAMGIALMLATLAGFALEGQHRRAQIQSVRKAFGTFLAPDYVRMLERDPGLVTAAAKRTEIAVLFTDLAGFTALIERLAPEAIEPFLNAYLDQVTNVIVAGGGTIDKIVGDSVHALFGVPIGQIDAAERALACAQEIVRVTEGFRNARSDLALGITRVGAHFGPALVGNFGGSLRLDYTAHGSTMNITSRLEAANTLLGTQVCISEAIYVAAGQPEGWRWCGSVWLRGVREPLSYFTLTHDRKQDAVTANALKAIESDPAASLGTFQSLDAADPIVQLQLRRLSQGLCSTMIDLR